MDALRRCRSRVRPDDPRAARTSAANNEQIRALPDTYPNVTVIDWDAEVANCVGNCLASIDNTHLSADGVTFYVSLIRRDVGI